MSREGIAWAPHPNTIVARIDKIAAAFGPRLAAMGELQAARAESLAKTTAPWTDQTGRARSGLRGSSAFDGSTLEIVLSYNVDYGIWLELAKQGVYATVLPTMQITLAETTDALRGFLR